MILLCGAALRLLNFDAFPTNDEAISGLAARGIAATGLPILPSGATYVRGLLYQYALGGAFLLPGSDEIAGKLLGVVLSLLTVLGVYRLALVLFGSRRLALGAALLAAVDPFSASYAARLRMYSALQAAVVWALVFFERDFVPRPSSEPRGTGSDENRAALAVGLPAVGLFAAALLVQQLAALLIPALALVWVATRGWRRSGLAWLVPAVAFAAAVYLAPRAVEAFAEPTGVNAVHGAYLSAPDVEQMRSAAYVETLRAKLPGRAGTAGRVALLLGALGILAVGVLLRSDLRGPGLRLLAYVTIPAGLVFLWPTGVFFDPRYFLHILPLAAVLGAAGVAAWVRPVPPPTSLVTVAATTASACFLAWGTPVWSLRYPAFLLPLAAGAIDGARQLRAAPGHASAGRLARVALGCFAWPLAAIAFALPLTGAALWWFPVEDFAPAMRYVAARHEPADVVLSDGHVPLVAWRLGDVDGAVPNFSLNMVRTDSAVVGDVYAGAPPVDTPEDLAALAGRARVWWFDYHPRGLDSAHAAFVDQRVEPLRRHAREHFAQAVACGDVTVYDSRPEPADSRTLDCALQPLDSAAAAH